MAPTPGGIADTSARKRSVDLGWNKNPEPNIAGYKVHVGTASRTYTAHRDVGKVTTATVDKLLAGTTYYFAVTAYNTAGMQSPPSNEVSARP